MLKISYNLGEIVTSTFSSSLSSKLKVQLTSNPSTLLKNRKSDKSKTHSSQKFSKLIKLSKKPTNNNSKKSKQCHKNAIKEHAACS